MPLIELTAPEGSLTESGRATIQKTLVATLMRWEGAPDNAFFRSISWSYLHEVPADAQTTAEDEEPRFLVKVTVPAGAVSDKQKEGLVADATKDVLAAAGLGEDQALRVWVLITEQADGTWGGGGQIFRYADLVALANG
ncbi:tautomerase family protein [Dietzia timorensis]|uniref:4-oxalocrotonate tautomerase domain-containing protein n=1 Tax=Dietzia timorensis TaxID=499555 RepID=A0A173LPZ3_9ACTN|nr:tautomerase family protein [Dietzia timorensis]ANI93367.1 Hypothetical protein BJL86_2607 [Dietzia timorensis]